jgi:hypothetical protein
LYSGEGGGGGGGGGPCGLPKFGIQCRKWI